MLSRAQLKRLFDATLIIKGVAAVFDLAAAAIIFSTGSERVAQFFAQVTTYMTHFDKDSFFSNYVLSHNTLSYGSVMFVAGYLFFHGVINIILVEGIWFRRQWAYMRAMRILIFFVLYQSIRLAFVFSYWLFAVTLYDLMVIMLMYNEYRHERLIKAAAKTH
jgi:uncharacterized membrane protein